MYRYILLILFIISLWPRMIWGWAPLTFDKANKEYQKDEFEKAAKLYQDLEKNEDNEPKVNYNLGNTYFRQGKYNEAEVQFKKSLNTKEAQLREQALYNLGNTKYYMNDLQGAVDYYNKVLEIDPKNKKAELNRDFVLKKMEEQKKQKEEQEKKSDEKEEQDSQEQNSENSENQEDQSSEEESEKNQEQEQKEEEKNNQDQKENQQDQVNQDSEEQSQENEEKSANQQVPLNLSQKEANQWLQSIEDDPKEAIKDMIMRDTERSDTNVEKDW